MFNKKGDINREYELYNNKRNSGGSIGSFFGGLILLCIGVYLIFQNTIVRSNFSLDSVIGFTPSFGLVLLPLIIGIVILFFNGKSWIGWILLVFGAVTILLGILMGLRIRFMPVTLYEGLLMYGMAAAGLGLVLKGLFGK